MTLAQRFAQFESQALLTRELSPDHRLVSQRELNALLILRRLGVLLDTHVFGGVMVVPLPGLPTETISAVRLMLKQERFEASVSETDILNLVRCGVQYTETQGFYLVV